LTCCMGTSDSATRHQSLPKIYSRSQFKDQVPVTGSISTYVRTSIEEHWLDVLFAEINFHEMPAVSMPGGVQLVEFVPKFFLRYSLHPYTNYKHMPHEHANRLVPWDGNLCGLMRSLGCWRLVDR